jgi:hypothetical protein
MSTGDADGSTVDGDGSIDGDDADGSTREAEALAPGWPTPGWQAVIMRAAATKIGSAAVTVLRGGKPGLLAWRKILPQSARILSARERSITLPTAGRGRG